LPALRGGATLSRAVPSSPGSIVVALGGNALAPPGERASIHDQFRHTRESLAPIVELAAEGWRIAVVHGNGPQVGDELFRNEVARDRVAPLPLGVLVAATAGWIGYMIQQSLQNALRRAGVRREVLTVVTQTVVDTAGPDALRPSKPIGHELPLDLLERMRAAQVTVAQDAGKRWRRLAPSPVPLDVVEADAVKRLMDGGAIVIAAGGGGPPVYFDPARLWEGVDAVVDKDRVAAILARRVGADTLLILTDVEAVYRGWGTPQQSAIRRLRLAEAEQLLRGSELGEGSMRPKVEAAVHFIRDGGRRAVITHLARGRDGLAGETGTLITGVVE
jgi:carbamate kinase